MARGNPGHHPRNHDEPKPGELAEDCPPELTLEEERAEWTRTIVPAITTGQITQADRTFAIAHCHYWATWRDQLADAARHPNIIGVGPNKHPTPNPARGMANTTFLLLAKVDAELGLTPSSRPRVKATRPAGQASSISRYLSAIPGGKASNH
jgi:P27 family predicted phage terminase small subunit